MKIGLFGFGCVASGVYESLIGKSELATIEKICVKNLKKKRNVPAYLFTGDPDDILEDDRLDVIIELIDDSEKALIYVKRALEIGLPVISANKKMIAENLELLQEIQNYNDTPFLYEGAVAGSIPILKLLNSHFKHQEIHSIRGILNGSTNYILSQMHEEQIPFSTALKKAQKSGFAESDPTLDVSGMDILYKSQLLTYHAFGPRVDSTNLKLSGIDRIPLEKIEEAKSRGQKIKLMAHISRKENRLETSIEPVEINPKDAFFLIDNEFNAIEVESSLSGKHFYVGKGAGSLPTASAVLSDLQQLVYLNETKIPV